MIGLKKFLFLKTYFGIKKNKDTELQLNILVLQNHKHSVNTQRWIILFCKKSDILCQFVNRKKLKPYEICNRMCPVCFCPCLGPVNPSAAALRHRKRFWIRNLIFNNWQPGLVLQTETDICLREQSRIWAAEHLRCCCPEDSNLWQGALGMTFCINLARKPLQVFHPFILDWKKWDSWTSVQRNSVESNFLGTRDPEFQS